MIFINSQKYSKMVLKDFGKRDKDDFSYVIFAIVDSKTDGLNQKDISEYYSYYNTAPVSVFVVPDGM